MNTIDQQQARFNAAIVGCADEMVRICVGETLLVDDEMLQPVTCPFCGGFGKAVQHSAAREVAYCAGCAGTGSVYYPVALMGAV